MIHNMGFPGIVVFDLEVWQLRELYDEILDPLGLDHVCDHLRDKHREHGGSGVRQRIRKLKHDDRERYCHALITWAVSRTTEGPRVSEDSQ